jgi:putative RecB family exonuclease
MKLMRDLPVLSASSLHAYLGCPQMWKLRYVDRRPQPKRWYLNLGTAVHAALERFHSGRVAAPATVEEMLEAFEEKLDPEAYTSAEDLERARADGRQMVRDFHATHAPDFQPAARVELPIRFVFENERFRGYVDRVDKTADGGVRVVDYKTGGRLTLSRAREDDQLTIYQIGVEAELGLPVRSVALYDVRSQILLEVERHGEHRVEALRRKVRRVARAIRAGEFEPRPGRSCGWCDYKAWCPAFAHLYPENWIQEPLPPTPTHAEAAELADRYGRLKAQVRDRARELAQIKRDLHRFFADTGERAVAGEQFEVRAEALPVDPDVPDHVVRRMKAIGRQGVRWRIRYRELEPAATEPSN